MKNVVVKICIANFLVYFLVLSVCALQDSFVTIDGKGVGVCLAVDDPDNFVCDSNSSLVLDGTRDHNIYFFNNVAIRQNDTFASKLRYLALTPLQLIQNSLLFIGGVICCVMFVRVILRFAGVRSG